MITLRKFIKAIHYKDVEGENHTYLWATVGGVKYGQSYPNTVYTREYMRDAFAVFYYQLVQEQEQL